MDHHRLRIKDVLDNMPIPKASFLPAEDKPVVDLVPASLRRQWASEGIYPGTDLFSSFLAVADARPLAAAVIDGAASLSYAQLRARSLSLASTLHSLGIRPGDVLAVNLPNGWRACA